MFIEWPFQNIRVPYMCVWETWSQVVQAKVSPVKTTLRVLLGYFDGDCLDLSVLLKSIFTPEIQKKPSLQKIVALQYYENKFSLTFNQPGNTWILQDIARSSRDILSVLLILYIVKHTLSLIWQIILDYKSKTFTFKIR